MSGTKQSPIKALNARLSALGCPRHLAPSKENAIRKWMAQLVGNEALLEIIMMIAAQSEMVRVVAWLEENKLKVMTESERETLKTDNERWIEALQHYLTQLKCPLLQSQPVASGNLPKYLHWLVSLAIGLQVDSSLLDSVRRQESTEDTDLEGTHVEELQISGSQDYELDNDSVQKLKELSNLLRLRRSDILLKEKIKASEALTVLQEAGRIIRQRLLTEVKPDGSRVKEAHDSAFTINEEDLSSFPSGINSTDPVVTRAATILRMFYVSDLRELQDTTNDILNSLQAYTADPKTNTSAGKVGR